MQRTAVGLTLNVTLLLVLLMATPALAQKPLDRSVLPIPEPQREPMTELDVRKAKAPPRFEVTAPKGAPNVVIVLVDDMGFSHPDTFGGVIAMPTLARLASSVCVTTICT